MDDFHRMLAEFFNDPETAFDATFIRQFPGVPNDDEGTVSSEFLEIPVRAIKMDVFGNMAGSRTKLGTLIQEADQVLYVQPSELLSNYLPIDPNSDSVDIKEVLWEVLAVKEYDPSGSECVLYEMYIKR